MIGTRDEQKDSARDGRRRTATAVAAVILGLGVASLGASAGGSVAAQRSPMDQAIDRIVANAGGTRADVVREVDRLAKEEGLDRVAVAEAMADDFEQDTAAVLADQRAAGAVTRSGDGGRIRLPNARWAGDIIYAPNVSHHFPHGHAALATAPDKFIAAPGGGGVVEERRFSARGSNKFAVGAKMMSVFTDKGKGPLLSSTKRMKAVKWALSRKGDKYRDVKRRNTVVVKGRPGSKGTEQNCSQLVWAAYKIANNYDFNPVNPLWKNPNPVTYAADKSYVWPEELLDAPQTVVYRTVKRDPWPAR